MHSNATVLLTQNVRFLFNYNFSCLCVDSVLRLYFEVVLYRAALCWKVFLSTTLSTWFTYCILRGKHNRKTLQWNAIQYNITGTAAKRIIVKLNHQLSDKVSKTNEKLFSQNYRAAGESSTRIYPSFYFPRHFCPHLGVIQTCIQTYTLPATNPATVTISWLYISWVRSL